LGFSIEDIRALLMLTAPAHRSCAEVKEIAGAHLISVQAKLADLAKLESILAATVAQCSGDDSPACPCSTSWTDRSHPILETRHSACYGQSYQDGPKGYYWATVSCSLRSLPPR